MPCPVPLAARAGHGARATPKDHVAVSRPPVAVSQRAMAADSIALRRHARRWTGPWLTPRAGSPEQSERRYRTRAELAEAMPPALRVDCYACDEPRRQGEVGTLVLDGEHWTCDACTADNRAAIRGETRGRRE